jgi:hypothetical protein
MCGKAGRRTVARHGSSHLHARAHCAQRAAQVLPRSSRPQRAPEQARAVVRRLAAAGTRARQSGRASLQGTSHRLIQHPGAAGSGPRDPGGATVIRAVGHGVGNWATAWATGHRLGGRSAPARVRLRGPCTRSSSGARERARTVRQLLPASARGIAVLVVHATQPERRSMIAGPHWRPWSGVHAGWQAISNTSPQVRPSSMIGS